MSTRAVTPTAAAPIATLTPLQRPMLQRTCDCGQHTSDGGECEDCRKKKKKMPLQRHASGSAPRPLAPRIVHQVLSSPGQPLDSGTRALMESRFRHDFSQVRVHTDQRSAESARAVSAHAYTVGRHVVFGAGEYSPRTPEGRSLLSHELTHVVQQSAVPECTAKLEIGEVQDAAEREAARVERTDADESVSVNHASPPRLQGSWDWEGAGVGALAGTAIGGAGAYIALRAGAPGLALGLAVGGLVGGFLIGGFTGGKHKHALEQTKAPSLDDPNFSKKWEAGLQKGLAHLKEVQGQGGCGFPPPARKQPPRYDTENWTDVASGQQAVLKNHVYKPNTKVPYTAVDQLYKNLDRWDCDCRLFGEIAQLFAWYEALRDRQDLFNKKFEGLRLSSESTTGLERTKIEGSDVNNAAWSNARVGSKMVWENTSPYAKEPWQFEHAIKSAKSTRGTPDLYAAPGVGFGKTEEEVKLEIAKQCVPDFPLMWAVTDDTIAKFKANGFPQDKIVKLESVKGKQVKYLTEFVKQPALVQINGGPIHIPYPDEPRLLKTDFRTLLFTFAERKDPPPDDKDVETYIRTNIHRYKVEIPK